MTRAELDIAVNWAAAEGWNPGLHDADSFYAADPTGFFLGCLGEEPIATLSAVRYSDAFGFLGFYIVKPEYRGQGYGLRLWQAGLAYLQGCTIGLDGVVAQQANYQTSGFSLAYNNARYQGVGGGESVDGTGIVPLSTLPFAPVREYDRAFFPCDRTDFLQCWLGQPQGAALGYLEDQTLAGYGVIRTCREGHKIGPLFADNAAIANQLFLALRAQVPEGAPIFLDIPMINPAAVELVERHQMQPVFETARMYKGVAPQLPLDRLFGVTTFELG